MFASDYSILEYPTIRPLTTTTTTTVTTKWKSNNIELAPNCPRCASSNTKFCYYNNYSLSQPRYFCKGCRRYWTKGGFLRNVPVGGGCRKSRRSRSARPQNGDGVHDRATATNVEPTNEPENGASIDLAAVFAKYVNNENGQEEFSSPSASGSSSDNLQTSSMEMESQTDDISTIFEYQKTVDLMGFEVDVQLQQGLPQIPMHEPHQDFFGHDSTAFDPLLCDELSWPHSIDLPVFGSQPSIEEQLQDFGLFSADDQLRLPANLISDSWNTFDPSSYEIFSRP